MLKSTEYPSASSSRQMMSITRCFEAVFAFTRTFRSSQIAGAGCPTLAVSSGGYSQPKSGPATSPPTHHSHESRSARASSQSAFWWSSAFGAAFEKLLIAQRGHKGPLYTVLSSTTKRRFLVSRRGESKRSADTSNQLRGRRHFPIRISRQNSP